MKHFVTPTFKGTRFDDHSIPLEVAKDLVAYEKLIIELTKHLYLEDHPSRARVPKGFGNEFQLHLEKVDPGSAKAVLSLMTAGSLAIGATETYFEKAKDLVNDCIAAQVDSLPAAFPRSLLKHFNYLGKSLEEGEELIFNEGTAQPSVLTPAKRRDLVLSASSEYIKDIQLKGYLDAPNYEKQVFTLRQENERDIECPMSSDFENEARKLVGYPRHIVSIEGVGAYDSYENLKHIVSINSIDYQFNTELSQMLDTLLELEDGWYGDGSVGFTEDKISQVATKLVDTFPAKIELPAVVPTPEGNILLEWQAPSHLSIDICLDSMVAELHAF